MASLTFNANSFVVQFICRIMPTFTRGPVGAAKPRRQGRRVQRVVLDRESGRIAAKSLQRLRRLLKEFDHRFVREGTKLTLDLKKSG